LSGAWKYYGGFWIEKIVHIDNSEFFRKLVKNFLTHEGFEVESFDNAEDAGMVISGGQAALRSLGVKAAISKSGP
jgi:DNA-binding NtrC family response regulator